MTVSVAPSLQSGQDGVQERREETDPSRMGPVSFWVIIADFLAQMHCVNLTFLYSPSI